MNRRLSRTYLRILHKTKDLLRFKKKFSPSGILVITILGIILAEVVAMIVVSFFRDKPYIGQVVLDTFVITVIIFPLLFFLSFKPLLLQIQRQNQSESVLRSRLRQMQYANSHSLDELLQFTLDELEVLTHSSIGFFHFLEAGENTLHLQAWSTNTLQNMCRADGKDSHYNVDQAGVWADAVRQRKPIIHNDYASLQHRKGTPDGHALVVRELVVPVLRDGKVRAILGVGNKSREYDANDLEIVSTLADFAWDIVERKRSEIALRQSEEKFRTLADWTYDWEKWLDPQGNLVYTSPSCERITGYTPQEFITDPSLLFRIVHPADQQFVRQHHKLVHDASAGLDMVEYRVLARDGSEHWIEHICRPLFGPDHRYLGRRISSREITARKQAEAILDAQKQKEALLTQALQNIQADIARDLHDTLGQNIGFLRMSLEHLSESRIGNPADLRLHIQNMSRAADESYGLIRAMLAVLQPVDSTDPLGPFTRYAHQIAERSPFHLDLASQGKPGQLSSHQIRHLFYIFREALSNAEKYAQATQVSGEFIWEQDALTLRISDNGCGFDPEAVQPSLHYGLKFMRERAELLNGTLCVHSASNSGTRVTVTVPYDHDTAVLMQ